MRITKIIKSLGKMGINEETILNKTKFREDVRNFEGFRVSVKSRRIMIYSVERGQACNRERLEK